MAERGAALVTALLLFALVAVITTAMMHSLVVDIRRAANLDAYERGFQYALGLEAWAIAVLRKDARDSGTHDSRTEAWAAALPPLDVTEGRLAGRLTDLDGRFNLNNLIVDGRIKSQQVARFRRLLLALELNPDLAAAVLDWVDSDTIDSRHGGEDFTYARAQPPYRTANAPFYHPSELRLVVGFEGPVYERLAPHIAALPVGRVATAINLNTATIPVLMSLDEAVTRELATDLYADGQANHDSLSKLFEHPKLANVTWQLWAAQEIPVSLDSRYFLAHAVVAVNGIEQHFNSVVEHGSRGFRVIYRARGDSY